MFFFFFYFLLLLSAVRDKETSQYVCYIVKMERFSVTGFVFLVLSLHISFGCWSSFHDFVRLFCTSICDKEIRYESRIL